MKSYLQALLTLLLGLCAALPLLGGDECGGGGENGVWILPRVGAVTRDPNLPARPFSEARAVRTLTELNKDFVFQTSGEAGSLVAVLCEANLGVRGINVCGDRLTVSARDLQLLSATVRRFDLIVLDENQDGYLLTFLFDGHGGCTVYVF